MKIKGRYSLLLPMCIISLLSACDIGPSGLSSGFDNVADGINTAEPPVLGETVSITGVAAKGLVFNGIIDIHPIIDGRLMEETSLANTRTNVNNGTYSVDISNYDGNPFIVRVTADDETTMMCDLPSGCGGGVGFGQPAPITDTEFNLDAIVPPVVGDEVGVNLSVLTDVASEVAINSLFNLTDTSPENILSAVNNANSSIANRFGIMGNLTSLPIVDLTNPASMVGASQNIIEYNLLSAAIVETLVGGDTSLSIAQAVQNFSSQFVTNGGLADTESTASSTVTLAEILAQASSVIDSIQAVDMSNVLNLSELSSIIDANQRLASIGSTEPQPGIPTDSTLSGLILAKNMVQDLRSVGTVLEDGFEEEEGLIDSSLDDDAGDVLAAVAIASEAIGMAWEAHDEDSELTNYTDIESGVSVAISTLEEAVTYTVDESIVVEDRLSVVVMMTAVDDDSGYTTTPDGETETTTASVDLEINGTSASALAELDLSGNLMLAFSGTSTDSQTETGASEVMDATLSGFSINVEATLAETDTNTDPVTFVGSLSLSLAGVTANETSNTTSSTEGVSALVTTMTNSVAVNELNVSLAGTFTAESGNSLKASVSVDANGSDFTLTCSEDEASETCAEETEDGFVSVSIATSFSLNSSLDPSSPTRIQLLATRTSIDEASLTMVISYDDVILSAAYDTDSINDATTIAVTNQSNVVLTLTETEDSNGEAIMSGHIVRENVTHATVSDSNGLLAASYTDGFNETIW